ncbi:MAG: acyltransferase [Burkholderiales bacterium]|nr:acyltransferase [Burkholderiales bacterium]
MLTGAQGGGAEPARDPALDGFRGCAVLLIVFLHYVVHHLQTQPGAPLAYAQKYLMVLWLGVDAFFVLSGFLIGGILLDQRAARNLFRVFYARRALRIFPAYFLLLACWWIARRFAAAPGMDWLMEPAFPGWPYLLYAQNFLMVHEGATGPNFVAATWSLAIEEQFYLLFPLVLRSLSARAMLPALSAGVALAPILRAAAAAIDPGLDRAQDLLLPTRWDSLLLGATVAWIVRDAAALAIVRRMRRPLTALLAGAAFCVALIPLLPREMPSAAMLAAVSGKYLVIAVLFALALLFLSMGWAPRLSRLLSVRPLRWVGRISYAVYLFHVPVLGLCFAAFLGKSPSLATWYDWAVTVLALVLTFAAAQATWLLFEDRLIRLGHHFKYDTQAKEAA